MQITERKVFSQHGEDGVIESIFAFIGTTNKFFVEIGCGDGVECNTRNLRENWGWEGFCFDQSGEVPERLVFRRRVTPVNVVPLLQIYGAPTDLDLLSIDIDSNDWWVLNAILFGRYRPRVIVAEYNAALGPKNILTVPITQQEWDHTDYFGASYAAFIDLGVKYEYTPVYVEEQGVNLFMVNNHDCPADDLMYRGSFYRRPAYGGHPPDPHHRAYVS